MPAQPAPVAAAPAAPAAPKARAPLPTLDDQLRQAGCSTCGGYHAPHDGPAFHGTLACGNGQCTPGRHQCYALPNEHDTLVGAFLNNLYQSLCCPDPCYQPRWEPAAYASFFADYARPRTVTRLRVDRGLDMVRPTRNEFFLKQTNPDFPTTVTRTRPNGTTRQYQIQSDPSLNFTQLYLYQEAAGPKGSLFFEYPYRQINPIFSETQAGFSDINFGYKSLLFDTELLQVSFQFRTFTPSGNSSKGLGTGHFSLDPSLMASLKLAPETYFQAQVGQWIPLGGTQDIQGGILYWFLSLNQVLYRFTPDTPLIGTLEMDGWSFQNGGSLTPIVPLDAGGQALIPTRIPSGGGTYFNVGPGLRLSICDKVDLGGALTWATTSNHWADPWFRFEVRFLF